ncbi:hypothetical protein [Flavobacterium ginsenosidimutans]|uniref:GIY-YIG domain-containing protein n=1 Tax=Flavobacterium ginsenosidimutans TaxID=687844 RepID=A0ABZ2Q9Q8_9FLAO
MNYANEKFPEDINILIQKCEEVITTIQQKFLDKECVIVKDLYHPKKGKRQIDFVQKLQLNCNAKLSLKNKINNEVKGLYVFGEIDNSGAVKPVYVGISRTVFRRLYQHLWGTKHNEASFAYLMAKNRLNHRQHRSALNQEELFSEQQKMKNFRLVVIPEDLEYDLYFMEIYISGRLKTKWNSFKTH